jgi:hypothetical protein
MSDENSSLTPREERAMEDYGHALRITDRALLDRIDKELAYVSRIETRALLRELRLCVCSLSADLWAAEAGASLDGCIIGELRESAKRVTGGNCAFADDDLGVLTELAGRAVNAGLTTGLDESILGNIAKATQASDTRGEATPSLKGTDA